MCAVDAMHLHSEPPVEDHSYKIKQFCKDNGLDIIQSTQPCYFLDADLFKHPDHTPCTLLWHYHYFAQFEEIQVYIRK